MAKGKKSFIAYSDWDGMFQELPDEVAGKLIKHIFSYVNDRNPETDDYVINALFANVKSTLKRDLKKWEDQRKQRSEAGKRSAEVRSTKSNDRSTTVNERQRKSTVSVSVNDSVNVNDSVSVKDKKNKRFKKPTILEIKNYCQERENKINPEKFYNYYEAKDWMIGKNKMKNWKAAIKNWENNDFEKPKQSKVKNGRLIHDTDF